MDLFLSHCAIPEYKIEIFNISVQQQNLIALHLEFLDALVRCQGVTSAVLQRNHRINFLWEP